MAEVEALTWEWVRAYPGISFWRAETAKWVYSVSVDEYELCFVASRFPNNPMADHASTGHLIERFPTVAEAKECVQKCVSRNPTIKSKAMRTGKSGKPKPNRC